MNIGERIKKARKSKGLTQKALAEKVDIAEITIRKYEGNSREPSFDMLQKVAAALDVSPWSLMGWEEPDPTEIDLGLLALDAKKKFSLPTTEVAQEMTDFYVERLRPAMRTEEEARMGKSL